MKCIVNLFIILILLLPSSVKADQVYENARELQMVELIEIERALNVPTLDYAWGQRSFGQLIESGDTKSGYSFSVSVINSCFNDDDVTFYEAVSLYGDCSINSSLADCVKSANDDLVVTAFVALGKNSFSCDESPPLSSLVSVGETSFSNLKYAVELIKRVIAGHQTQKSISRWRFLKDDFFENSIENMTSLRYTEEGNSYVSVTANFIDPCCSDGVSLDIEIDHGKLSFEFFQLVR